MLLLKNMGWCNMTWILTVIIDLMFNVICYLTNPIVVLFADEYGNLPKCLRWWQTYDNCLDVDWMIDEEIVPKIFRYDFHKHYIYHLEDKSGDKVIAGYVDIIDPNFTIKERVQRYFCRLCWLYRNAAYGFSYEISGRDYDPKLKKVYKDYKNSREDECHIDVVYDDRPFWNRTWRIYYTKQWFWKFYIRIYFGWKITKTEGSKDRAMLAFFINPFRIVKES